MTESWNISALCRCCHAEGNFKNLATPYTYDGEENRYSVMLKETFGIIVSIRIIVNSFV